MKKICMLCLVLLLTALLTSAVADEESSWFLEPGSEPVVTEDSYVSENIAIHITRIRHETPVGKVVQKSDIYVADIRVRNIRSFCRAYPGAAWGKQKKKITPIAEDAGAILAMSGDSASDLVGGWLVFNSELIRNGKKWSKYRRDVGILYMTGELVTKPFKEIDREALLAEIESGKVWQIFYFGPMLLDEEGHAMKKFNSDVNPVNPRSVIGYYEPGHYCFVQVDGRGTKSKLEPGKKNKGLTLANLSKFMEELGCKAAYNLDGGKTSQLYFNGAVISTPENGGRKLGDIVLVREPLPTDILVEDLPAETPAQESTETPTEAPSEESTETVTEQPAEIPETAAEIPEA